MIKRKTPESEYVQKRCVMPARKMKNKSLKNNDVNGYLYHGFIEYNCIKQRENSKK